MNKNKLKKNGKRLAKLGLSILILIIVFLVVAWQIVKSDHQYVIQKLQEKALNDYDAILDLDGYKLDWKNPFSNIHVQLEGIEIAKTHAPSNPFLKVNYLSSSFDPWDILTGNFSASPFLSDSIWVHIYKDSLSQSNLSASPKKDFSQAESLDIDFKDFPLIEINYLDFYNEEPYREKWQRAQLLNVKVEPRKINSEWNLHLSSQCDFDGLVFNEGDGAYLKDKFGDFNLFFSLRERGRILNLNPSWLKVKKDTFHLSGQFHRSDTNRILLDIYHNQAIKEEVMPLLSEKINRKLKDIQIDQPIKAKFVLDEKLIPGRKGAVNVYFETQNACAQYQDIDMTKAHIIGHYSNDCDGNGIGDLKSSCISFEKLDGEILGLIPAQLKGVISDLKEPYLDAEGLVEVDMPRLNPFLTAKNKFAFKKGSASVDFKYHGDFIEVLKAPFDEQNIEIEGLTIFKDVVLSPNAESRLPAFSGQLVFDTHETILEEMNLEWQGATINLTGSLSNLPEFMFYDNQALLSDLNIHFDLVDLNTLFENEQKHSTVLESKKLDPGKMEEMARKLANNINGNIKVQIDSLIYDTLFFTDFSTNLRLYSPLLVKYADSSMISIDQMKTQFMGQTAMFLDVELSQGSIPNVLLDIEFPSAVRPVNHFLPTGYSIYEGEATLALKAHFPLSSISNKSSLLENLYYDGRIRFDNMNARLKTFSLPIYDLNGGLEFSNQKITFKNLSFNYKKSPFYLNGEIRDPKFVKSDSKLKPSVDLELYGSHIDLRNNDSKNANAVDSELAKSPAEWFRSLASVYDYSSGKVLLRLDSVITPKHIIKPVLVNASLLPAVNSKDKYQLQIDSFNLGFGGQNNLKGSASIWNFDAPQIQADFNARMTFQKLGAFLPSEYIELRKGYFKMDVEYESPLHDTLSAINYLLNADINGVAELANGELFYNYRDFSFNEIFGRFEFDQKTIYIKDLDLELNGNPLFSEGVSRDFFAFFILPERRANLELKVSSPRFDFGQFTAPHGLGKDTLLGNSVNENIQPEGKTPTAGFIDRLLDKGSLEMDADFKSLVYKEFEGKNLLGHFSLQPDTVQLNDVEMELAEGVFKIDGAITDVVLHQPKMQVNVKLIQNNISEIFRQFENFGQDKLGYKNIEGLASADIEFFATANSNYSVIPETMHSDIFIKLTGGELKNVSALRKLTGFLFKKRKLDHVLIDTLEMNSHVRGTDMYMDEFYLHSTSFDFGAVGVYSFGEENNTKILFGVPVSNLFRRHLTQKELQSGTSKRKGMRIFVDVRPKKDKLKFRWKIPIFGKKKYRMKEESLPLENLRVD